MLVSTSIFCFRRVIFLCVVAAFSFCLSPNLRIPFAAASAPSPPLADGDVPVTPSGSALRRFRLYDPFGVIGAGDFGLAQPKCLPRHVHLSLGDEVTKYAHKFSPTEDLAAVTVSFSIPSKESACRPESLRVSVVYGTTTVAASYGDDGGNEERQYALAGDVRWYNTTSDRTGVYYESDWIYHMQLKGLKRKEEYYYRIEVEKRDDGLQSTIASKAYDWIAATPFRRLGNGAVDEKREVLPVISPTLNFKTAPIPGHRAPTKIALFGDLGQTYNSTQTMLNLVRETKLDPSKGQTPASLLFCAGDMSYADTDQSRWDNWFTLIEPLISRVALQVAAGNHEIECDATSKNIFTAYENRFRMPNPVGPADIKPFPSNEINPLYSCGTPSVFRGSYDGGNAYYAFTYGMVRFLALSPYSDTSIGSRQYLWLERELRAIDRSVTPWVVVVHHTQFYTTFLAHNDELQTTVMRQAMEPLFVQFGVNLVVSGHDHAYMRSRPMKYGASDLTGKGPIYIIVGEGGNREHHVKDYLHPDPEEWVDRRDRTEYGFGTLEVINSTWACWRWVRDGSPMAVESGDGVTDETWLQNQHFLPGR